MNVLNKLGLGDIKRDWVGQAAGAEHFAILPADGSLRLGQAVGMNAKGRVGPLCKTQLGFAGFVVEVLKDGWVKLKTRGAIELDFPQLDRGDLDRRVYCNREDFVLDPEGFKMGVVVKIITPGKQGSAHVKFNAFFVAPLP